MATARATAAGAPLPSLERPRWSAAHYLAILGAIFILWQGWTIVSWLADGPRQITEFRDRDTVSWVAARVYEGIAILLALGMGTYVVRGCIRERRLTLDAKICIAGALTLWLDPFTNAIQPLWFYSSNWVNLNSWCGNQPLIVNPDCGQLPMPMFLIPMYTFGMLTFAMMINVGMRAVRRRWPGVSTPQLLGLVFVFGCLADISFELPMFLMRLWAYPGTPHELAILGGRAYKLPLIEILAAGLAYAFVAAIRFFRDDSGRSVVERGLDRLPPWKRSLVSLVALVGLANGVWFVATGAQAVVGLYADPYRKMPAHLVNDMCDAPGFSGARYGPCPEQGYRAPIRKIASPTAAPVHDPGQAARRADDGAAAASGVP